MYGASLDKTPGRHAYIMTARSVKKHIIIAH